MTAKLTRSAIAALQRDVETCAQYIERVTPKYAPLPPHQQRICDVIDATRRGEVYAMISMPPRHGKTESLAHGLAYRTLYDPACLNFYATFGANLAVHTSRKVRKLARASGVQLSPDAQAVQDWRTIFDGGLKATSVGGDVTGRGCNSGLIVADDLVKGRAEAESKLIRDRAWDWFRDDLMSRLEPGASLIVNMTRWHEDDIIGRLKSDSLGLKWVEIVFPAVHNAAGEAVDEQTDPDARPLWSGGGYTLERYAQIRARGEHGWWSLYQQSPYPKGGKMFKREWFQLVDEAPSGGVAVRGWDFAATKDGDGAATAGVRIRRVDGRYFIEHVEWLRGSPYEVERAIVATAERDGRDVVIDMPQDPGQAGKAQIAYLVSKLAGYRVQFSPESKGGKELRAEPLAAQAQAGNVFLVRGNWNDAYLDEVEAFPVGRLKDRVDASSRAFAALTLHRAVSTPVSPEGGELDTMPARVDDPEAHMWDVLTGGDAWG